MNQLNIVRLILSLLHSVYAIITFGISKYDLNIFFSQRVNRNVYS